MRMLTMIDKTARFRRTWRRRTSRTPARNRLARRRLPATPRQSRRQSAAAKPAGPTVTDYTLEGVVRSVDPKSGQVLIRHREIPGFMAAMTMPFKPANREVLETLQPGDAGRRDLAGREGGRGRQGLPAPRPEGDQAGRAADQGPRCLERKGSGS